MPESMNEQVKAQADELVRMLRASRRAVFFGGAGVSTESGIPDFRSTDGLYHQQWRDPPETILSRPYFDRRTEDFFRFYREKMIYSNARPSGAHRALAELEARGLLHAVITQNIDGLHQMAGSRNVLELHGSVHRNTCMACGAQYDLNWLLHTQGVPRCSCGGVVKPDVVLYGEPLDDAVTERAAEEISRADLLIIGGTSLSVYPAAGFVQIFSGRVVLINKTPTPYDNNADLIVRAPIGVFLYRVAAAIGG